MLNFKNSKQNKGFSLIELMIVIAIIAILATIAMPSQIGSITQKQIIETLDLVDQYKTNINTFYRANAGNFPENNEQAGMPEPNKIIGVYLRKVEVRDGALHLHLGQKIAEPLHNKIISLRPVYVDNSPKSPISWICAYNSVPDGMKAAGTNLTDLEKRWLPGRCR